MKRITGDWLNDKATQQVMRALSAEGNTVYFVGGCVRNAALGVAISDIDIATDATPQRVTELASAATLKAIPTGIEHGTVTIVAGGIAFEVTTFRKDIETDGRRAVVSFSDNITDDARRRDFTMNALYADASGVLHDPLDGLADLVARRVRFIDDANARIKEDYLRSLRFFRFHAIYGNPANGMDAEALAAIAVNLDGIRGLSKERVGSEMLKLLSAPDPAPSVAAMAKTGVLSTILPGTDERLLAILVHFEKGQESDAIRRLAILGGDDPTDLLRLSREQTKQWALLRAQMAGTQTAAENGYRYGVAAAINIELLRAALFETPPNDDFRDAANMGATQKFPVAAADLMDQLSGLVLGNKLRELETKWIRSGFTLTREQLLP